MRNAERSHVTTCVWSRTGLAAALVVAAGAFAAGQSAGQLTICHAGSLTAAFTRVEKALTEQHPGIVIKDVSGGSVALAGQLAAGLQPCDIYATADYEDVDLLLKPAGLADYAIVFAKGRMVLAYLATDPMTHGVAAAGEFRPPASIPPAAADWYRVVLEPGVRIAGSHPFLDPGGYRAHMIFQLAQSFYNVPDLNNLLLEHYEVLPAAGGDAASRPTLGKDFNFQFTYEHAAITAAKGNPSYRYVTLPDRIDLSTVSNNGYYARAAVTMPGLGGSGAAAPAFVSVPATRAAWGLTISKKAANPQNAIAFVELLLGTTGTAALTANGPAPITPAFVSTRDYVKVPKSMQPLVRAGAAVQ